MCEATDVNPAFRQGVGQSDLAYIRLRAFAADRARARAPGTPLPAFTTAGRDGADDRLILVIVSGCVVIGPSIAVSPDAVVVSWPNDARHDWLFAGSTEACGVHLFDRVRPYAATVYSWMRPPSRLRLRIAVADGLAVVGVWGVFIRSGIVLGGDRVLVDEAAEPVVSVDRGGSRRRVGLCWGPGFGGCESERAVRAMAVVMADELGEHSL